MDDGTPKTMLVRFGTTLNHQTEWPHARKQKVKYSA
jgi:hypothetical protein